MTKLTHILIVVLSCAVQGGRAHAQTTWQPSGAPTWYDAHYCYDAGRDRTVYVDGTLTAERNGTTGSWSVVSSVFSPTPGGSSGGIAYDRTRGRVVCMDGGDTWHWDGTSWSIMASGSVFVFRHLVAHSRRGTVIAFGGTDPYTSNDLYEWDGASWNHIAG
jgi:hypothetical protein